MWTDVKSTEARDALVQDYLERKKRLQSRFQAEKLGEADLQFEASKLFNPITGAVEKQALKQATEIANVTWAIERLPAKIVDEANFNPIAALLGAEPPALPAPPLDPSFVVNADKNLDLETIKRYKFKPLSELNFTNVEAINRVVEGVNRVINKLGQDKRKDRSIEITDEQRAAIDLDQDALRDYRSQIRLLSVGYKLIEPKKGSGLKLKGNQFGSLTIDPLALEAGKLRAFTQVGGLALEAPADHSLYDLMTKRLFKTKQYTPAAVDTFKKLVDLAGLPIHGRKSKKHQLIRGGAIQYYNNNPDTLVKRLQLLLAEREAGNTGVDEE